MGESWISLMMPGGKTSCRMKMSPSLWYYKHIHVSNSILYSLFTFYNYFCLPSNIPISSWHYYNVDLSIEWIAPFIHGILSPLFSVRVNCLRLSRTMEVPQSLWKSKRWSGQTSPCRACTKTHRALATESLMWNQTIGHIHTCRWTLHFYWSIYNKFQLSRDEAKCMFALLLGF